MKYFSLIFFFLGVVSLQAQVQFDAKISREKLGINERLRVEFIMNQNGDNFIAPENLPTIIPVRLEITEV